MTSLQHKTRGAALIVAILVLTILLVIVLAFFQASRQEMHIATNYRNATQADLLAEGGTALAIAFLNHDRSIHPTVTSIDHAWKTYFNGSWAAGKPWLWKYGATINTVKGEGDAVPEYNLDWWMANRGDPLGDALYIPRVDGVGVYSDIYNSVTNPFVVNYPVGQSGLVPGGITGDPTLTGNSLGPLQVDRFADWDNDEDGLRDSAWIPMPMDVFPDVPLDEDGDGIDNDLDGWADERPDGLDNDGDTFVDEEDEATERAIFVYWGGNDGLDNDGDNTADEADEQKPFLTTPFPPLDLDGDGVIDVTTYANIPVQARNPVTGAIDSYGLDPNRGSADVDTLDNDYNLVVNESLGLAYTLIDVNSVPVADQPAARNTNRMRQATGYHVISPAYLSGITIPAGGVITFSGEPVCELVGRVAVLVKDENSKVNMNAAGGRNFRDDDSPYVQPDPAALPVGGLRRALWNGASTSEYETGVLPQVGPALRDRLWNLRTGAHAGIGFSSVGAYANIVPGAASYDTVPYNFDTSLPGFGRVDDNGNALWMAMDGVDNDGDGLIDEGLSDLPHWDITLPPTNIAAPNGVMDTDEAWTFEGIDEPQEYQSYRPYRNKAMFPVAGYPTAEEDGLDNADAVDTGDHPTDGAVDEIGELGDRYLRSTEQLKLAETLGAADFDKNRNLVTVNSTDLNSRFQRYDSSGALMPVPALSGPKLDYNYATTEQIFNAIWRDWGYVATPPTGAGGDALAYAVGLRREDTAIFSDGILGGLAAGGAANFTRPDGTVEPAYPPDLQLRAAQLAASIRDARDTNLGRTEVTTTINDTWSSGRVFNGARPVSYTQAGIESIRINEIMARAVRRVEAEMNMSMAGAPAVPVEPRFFPNAFSVDPLNDPDFNMQVRQLDASLNPIVVDAASTPWTRQGEVIGDRSAIATTTLDTDPPTSVIQFRFAPSPGLPPASANDPANRRAGGRYYLMMNSQRYNEATGRMEATVVGSLGTVTSDNIEYVFKYGTAADDILTDVADAPATVPWKNSAIVGYRDMGFPVLGEETGLVFLPSDENYEETAPLGYGDNEAYTVHIPPYNTVTPADQLYLYVAIRFVNAANADNELAVNYFDFSQEPDHEWIEVVNTAQTGEPVNIGGWELQVGPDNMRDVNNTPVPATRMTVPPNTLVAPGGSLLLTFNKYDAGGHDTGNGYLTGTSLVLNNGIGMARILDAAYEMYMSEPPIPDVFARNSGDSDFLDWDGDGLVNADEPGDAALQSSPDETPTGFALAGANKPWDRIVQVHVDLPTALESVTGINELAELVLSGGIFPNYPEHDGVDNDGDIAALLSDGVDNDGDGLIDEGIDVIDGIDNNADGTIDEAGERLDGVDFRPEGVDEGRWEYILDPVTTTFYGFHGTNPPASYSYLTVPYRFADTAGTPGNFTATYIGAGTDVAAPGIADAPEWKHFAEKRWYAPDNVIVTLYAGKKDDGFVADRITYSEGDVINRAADDIITCPYPYTIDEDGDLIIDRNEIYTLNPNLPTFWPDNTMGADFYRAIERKHPLYNGDLHGLSNRWQATDGSYDDWSPSTSVWARSNADGTVASRDASSLYNHAFSGSPLRMNLAQRLTENPNDQFVSAVTTARRWAFERARQGFRNHNYTSPGDLASLASFMDSRQPGVVPVAPATIEFDDVPINYAVSEDLTVQGVLLAQHPYDNLYGRDDMAAVMSTAAMDPLVLAVGTANFYTITPQPGVWNADGWDGTIATTAPQPWTPVFLFPLPGADADPVAGEPFPLDANRLAQYAMSPLDNYLFTGPYGGAITNNAAFDTVNLAAADLSVRWPLKLRTVMYASQNIDGFDPALPHDDPAVPNPAATALFEWDGADGLENGDYDVYIMTADDLAPVAAADFASRTDPLVPNTGRYMTQFGRNLLLSASGTDTGEMAFDLEMFTDRNYTGTANLEPLGPNGRCWVDTNGDNYPQPEEFERANTNLLNPQGDSFGALLSKTPDENGAIYYGTVRVENNYLALLLRNWTDNNELARFSRVILTPRPRTTGRLNINTVESAMADFGASSDEFNPLVGTPGMLVDYVPASVQRFGYFNEGDIGPLAGSYIDALTLSNNVVSGREHFDSETGVLPVRFHADGRYYENPSDLVAPHPNEFPTANNMNTYPVSLNATGAPAAEAFEEMMGRYSRLANLVTTRSDVFEVTVTAQTGYLSSEDLNGDGRIDYRNDFIVTGEKKIRTVYER